MKYIELLACAAGLVSGFSGGWLSIVLTRRLGDNGFWRRLLVVAGLLLSSDEGNDFFREYLQLLPVLFSYTVKKLATLTLAGSPVVLAFVCLTSLPAWIWDTHARYARDWELDFSVVVSLTWAVCMLVIKPKA